MSKKIIVIDDSLTARRLLAQHLKGHTLLEASNGLEAIELLDQNTDTSIVFVDINMPWMDGLEFLKKIRGEEKYKNVPVCILTTENGIESLEEAKKLGADAFIVKPASKEQVESILANLSK